MLEKIDKPEDLRKLTYPQLYEVAAEMRAVIESTVLKRGGHLASNLGAIELTLALHRVYDAPRDKIVFDVGHQAYAHKLVTGRRDRFDTLRSRQGLCGFPSREESEYDAFGVGHASTGASAALGFARARDALGEGHHVVAVVGDGALTGGEAYEALNDAGQSGTPLVIVLNDNGMSISRNVGGLTRHLTRLRTSRGYWRIKNRLTLWMEKRMKSLLKMLQSIKNGVKYLLINGKFFDALGFVYFGPVDGHDIRELEMTLRRARQLGKPVLVHVVTRKGKGLPDAEEEPERFHGVSYASVGTQEEPSGPCAGALLAELAREDRRICAVTAAMPLGTGMRSFGKEHPDRLYDVGIAEEHAATLAAALAAGGMRPYLAVYSTFFQRCYDQAFHDIALQKLPVTLLLDRAGLTGEDGATHQGVNDIPLLATMPGMHIYAPATLCTLCAMVEGSLSSDFPIAIRYPRALPKGEEGSFTPGRWKLVREGAGTVVLAVGPMVYPAAKAAREVPGLCVICVESIWPLDRDRLGCLAGRRVLTVEEGTVEGGFGSMVASWLAQEGILVQSVQMLGTPREALPHASVEEQRRQYGLDAQSIARTVRTMEAGHDAAGSAAL